MCQGWGVLRSGWKDLRTVRKMRVSAPSLGFSRQIGLKVATLGLDDHGLPVVWPRLHRNLGYSTGFEVERTQTALAHPWGTQQCEAQIITPSCPLGASATCSAPQQIPAQLALSARPMPGRGRRQASSAPPWGDTLHRQVQIHPSIPDPWLLGGKRGSRKYTEGSQRVKLGRRGNDATSRKEP